MTDEEQRLQEHREGKSNWKRWGPYVSARAWGTVREDYSPDGSAWSYFSHDHARSRAYRWNEDGLLGICDDWQQLCFALALWNGKDPILKERFFGLTGEEGNHGEDVKEYWFYLDNTPTHSYMKALYKYPQAAFPYGQLVEENRQRTRSDPEFELLDTGVFQENRYFDVVVEYAKAGPEDILIAISATNRGPDAATLDLIPMLWFRNTWSWGEDDRRPKLSLIANSPAQAVGASGILSIEADHFTLGKRWLTCQATPTIPPLYFTENETNYARLFPDVRNTVPYVKDSINDTIVHQIPGLVNPENEGSKAGLRYTLTIGSGETETIRLRLSDQPLTAEALAGAFDDPMNQRRQEADAFYATVAPQGASEDMKRVQRQALAGMLWNKQYYHYDVRKWLQGDQGHPPPPPERWEGRNHNWLNLDNSDILSMPDAWEYPWYASWDLAFHSIALSIVDSDFAKEQLILLLREWYMHPNGQLPAYEWSFSDVNPPVHAWAAHRVYQIEMKRRGVGDTNFLERVFHKLLLNFTWWVNRKDAADRNVFQGGFLGLDNIGIFDRSKPLPSGGYLDQSDGTSWMAMFCLNMLAIALDLAASDPTYEDVATKFLEHFFYIAHAMNDRPSVRGDDAVDLWDEDDGFYYDVLHLPDGTYFPLRIRSMVGLIPLLAVETMDADLLAKLPNFRERLLWFLNHRPDLCADAASVTKKGEEDRRLFSVVNKTRLREILTRMLDPTEFLAPTGLRALSRFHHDHPYRVTLSGVVYQLEYQPAESQTGLFGGNSNWRGPVWFPINYLIIEALQKFDYYYGDDFKIEFPIGSGKQIRLWDVSVELSRRLISTFLRDENGRRPAYGGTEVFQTDPNWRDLILFHEYFNGDDGAGLGASHQTGWTGLVAKLIQQSGEKM